MVCAVVHGVHLNGDGDEYSNKCNGNKCNGNKCNGNKCMIL